MSPETNPPTHKRKTGRNVIRAVCEDGRAALLFAMVAALPGFAPETRGGETPVTDAVRMVENDETTPRTVPLATLRLAPVPSRYLVRGRARHTDVEGRAYLEMWSVSPDGTRYFSRTLASSGSMAPITGTSPDWRPIELPFDWMGAPPVHADIEINAVLPGRGRIEIAPLTLVNLTNGATPTATDASDAAPAWFTERQVAQWGGWGGGVLGTLGGLFGAFCGWCAPRGRGRRWVMGGLVVMTVAGGVLLGAGVLAWTMNQPWYITLVFLLPGALLMALFPGTRRTLHNTYTQAEQRKIQALDA